MPQIIVMLLWLGSSSSGGPAVISGFVTLKACEGSVHTVLDSYKQIAALAANGALAKCVSLPTGEAPRS